MYNSIKLFADDAPERKEITIDFFENFIKTGTYETYISEFVVEEIMNTGNENKRAKLLEALETFPMDFVEEHDSSEIQELAKLYVDHGIIPENKVFDAYHIATSVVNRIDYLVSWNFRHLANVNKERRVLSVNIEKTT